MADASVDAVEVVTLGECLASLVAAEPGPLAGTTAFTRFVAGAEANVVVGLARLGHRVAYVGRVGRDGFGVAIERGLRGEGVDVRGLSFDDEGPTGVMVRERRVIGQSEVLYHRRGSAGSRVSADDVRRAVDSGAFQGARWLHLTGITPALSDTAREAVAEARAQARSAGMSTSFDVNLRRKLWSEAEAAPVLRDLAGEATLVFGSVDELALVAARTVGAAATADEVADIADAVLALGPTAVVVKLGASGASERRSTGQASTHAGYPIDRPVDPVGAGDAFVAGYLAATLEGLDGDARLALANACGAAVAGTVGDVTGAPTRAEAQAIIAAVGDVRR